MVVDNIYTQNNFRIPMTYLLYHIQYILNHYSNVIDEYFGRLIIGFCILVTPPTSNSKVIEYRLGQ